MAEYTGGSVSYYTVRIAQPTNAELPPYQAECNDIIEALGMNYAEGNAFKALWRRAAARNLGMAKQGYQDGLYDAEKVVFFGQRLVAQESPTGIDFLGAPSHATHRLASKIGYGFVWAFDDAGTMRDCHTQYVIDMDQFTVAATRKK